MEREPTGPIPAPLKINSCLQDQNLDLISDSVLLRIIGSFFIQGKLRANLSFGREAVRASDFALDIIENGYKILFQKSPLPYSIENRSSALLHRGFVREALPELLTRGCIKQLSV